jgi:hypothetical protein
VSRITTPFARKDRFPDFRKRVGSLGAVGQTQSLKTEYLSCLIAAMWLNYFYNGVKPQSINQFNQSINQLLYSSDLMQKTSKLKIDSIIYLFNLNDARIIIINARINAIDARINSNIDRCPLFN